MALAGSRTAAGDAQSYTKCLDGLGAIISAIVVPRARVHVLLVRTKRMLLGHNKDRL